MPMLSIPLDPSALVGFQISRLDLLIPDKITFQLLAAPGTISYFDNDHDFPMLIITFSEISMRRFDLSIHDYIFPSLNIPECSLIYPQEKSEAAIALFSFLPGEVRFLFREASAYLTGASRVTEQGESA